MEHFLRMFEGDGSIEKEHEEAPPQQTQPQGMWEYEMPLPQEQGSAASQGDPGLAGPPSQEPAFSIPGGIPKEALDIQESTIEGYYQNLGWQFEKLDQGLWILKFKGSAKDYDIYVELNPPHVVLVIPVLERVRDACREKLWYHLLRMNYLSSQARFGLNKRDEVLLTIEIPLATISYGEFQKGLQYLCSVTDDAFPELLFLSQRPEALSSFTREAEPPPPPPQQMPEP
ncbi:MAG: hypothetical protein AB2L14_04675 [Candidatus Xenobiia bacterium LiM19]